MVDLRILHAKISPLGQKLWPTGREQMYTQTHRHTEKVNTEDPFFRFFVILYYLKKERTYIKDVGI